MFERKNKSQRHFKQTTWQQLKEIDCWRTSEIIDFGQFIKRTHSLLFITVSSKGKLSPNSTPFSCYFQLFPPQLCFFFFKYSQKCTKVITHYNCRNYDSYAHRTLFFVLTCTFSLLKHFTLNQHYLIMQNSAAAFNFRPDILVASHRSSASHPYCQHYWRACLLPLMRKWREAQSWHSAKSIHCFYFCATSRHKNILLGTKSHSWVMQSWTRLRSFKNTALHVKLKQVSVIDFPVKHLAGCIF